MKAVLMSIRPEWCEKILAGEKIMELRKSQPKLKPPFKVYIYCTYGAPFLYANSGKVRNGKVIAEFNCPHIQAYGAIEAAPVWMALMHKSCLSMEEIQEYGGDASWLYGWYIAGLKIYNEPKPISYFMADRLVSTDCYQLEPLKRPPQSWCYVEEVEE